MQKDITISFIIIYILAVKSLTVICERRNNEDYLLPKIYKPYSYKVTIGIEPEAFSEESNEFAGKVHIDLSFKNRTNFIALHAHPKYITIKTVRFNGMEIDKEHYAIDNETEILRINMTYDVRVEEKYTLVIEYTGLLNTKSQKGLFKLSYDNIYGNTKYILGTLFDPVHTRKVLPCFDEPSLKSTYDYAFKIPMEYNILFSTPAKVSHNEVDTGMTTIIFAGTPKISTNTIGFVISQFTCTAGKPIGFIKYQVCSRPEKADDRLLAVAYGPKIIEKLDQYFEYEYGAFGFKVDQVAFPKYYYPASENLGVIAYLENILLWNAKEDVIEYKQQAVTFLTHELSHQWFGNLITPHWWSESYLVEGMAVYLQFHITNEILPLWELDKQFVIEMHYRALALDSQSNSKALQSECYTPSEIESKFMGLTYFKGGSIFAMVQHIFGLRNFWAGIRHLIREHSFETIIAEDVWTAMNESTSDSISDFPTDFSTIMDNWINKPGYPLLFVTLNGREVTITQKKFFSSGKNDTQWYVPISYSTSLDTDKFERTYPMLWLTPNGNLTFTLPINAEWIILNNRQTALYRVNYDENLWSNIANALLKKNFDGIGALNRAQIVNDLFHLAEKNVIKYTKVFQVIKFLANDTSYYPWITAFNEFDMLFRKIGDDTPLSRSIAFPSYGNVHNDIYITILNTKKKEIKRLIGQGKDWETTQTADNGYFWGTILEWIPKVLSSASLSVQNFYDHIYSFKQTKMHILACSAGHEKCIEEVRAIFKEFKRTKFRPNPNLHELVYCQTLRYSNDSSDWHFLWQAYIDESTKDLLVQKEIIRKCLGYSRNEEVLKEFLNKSITDGSGIKTIEAFFSVTFGGSIGANVAFEFIVENVETIIERRKDSLGNILHMATGKFVNESQVSKLREFIESGKLPERYHETAKNALKDAEAKMKRLKELEDDLKEFYNCGGIIITVSVSAWILCAVILLFY